MNLEGLEKNLPIDKPVKYRVVGIKFRNSGKIYDFICNDMKIKLNDQCIVETERGLSVGEVVSSPRLICERVIHRPLKPIVRLANFEDLEIFSKNLKLEREAYLLCQRRIADRKLPMKLVSVEFLFNSNKAIFYFTAEGRVDFRELVKDLANHFKLRIEMKQIGIRDEAKMCGGYGCCGRYLCCTTFLKDFEPVSIRMAKEQNLSLNPAKISGVCGRLMCCLVYEHETYMTLKKTMPTVGKRYLTPEGEGKVIKVNALLDKVMVELADEKRMEFKAGDLKKLEAAGVAHGGAVQVNQKEQEVKKKMPSTEIAEASPVPEKPD